MQTGVLLVNLGTPDSHEPRDVRRYLLEFLTDGRVIDLPWLKRQLLTRCILVPKRYRASAENYARIWTADGSPLKWHGEHLRDSVQEVLGPSFQVELAMRYQNPSIEFALNRLKSCPKLIVLPLFPQYASATTGSVHQKIMEILCRWETIPELRMINSYPLQSEMVETFCERGRECEYGSYDHILFSFHGLPERHLRKADPHEECLRKEKCCETLSAKNQGCYGAQCYATAGAIASGLGLSRENYTVTFQSRLGKDPWTKPYTQETMHTLLKQDKKKLLVFCPAFVCDCLETIDEIGHEYRKEFLEAGGTELKLVPSLNNHPLWVKGICSLIR